MKKRRWALLCVLVLVVMSIGGCGSTYTGTSTTRRDGGYNGGGSANSYGGVGGGAVAGGVVGAVVGGVAGLIGAIHNEMTPQTSIVGGSGNKADLSSTRGYILLSRRTYGSKEFATSVAGRPLMQNVRLGNLSGFCKCGNASVPVNARDEERDMINSYLNSGVYIE